MKVLVTGGAGFIGRHLVEHLQGKASVVVIDNLRSGFAENLRGLDCTFVAGSILDRDLVRYAMQDVDCVFHLAALVSVPESMEKPEECMAINSGGTLLILEEAARAGVHRMAFSSSAAIYGDNPTVPKLETMPPEPKSPYANSKLEGEVLCQSFAKEHRLTTVCLRYFNVFGPCQSSANQYAAAIPLFIDRALSHEPVVVFGDGRQTRDFIYVHDVVAANAFFGLESSRTGIFNVACGNSVTIRDLVATICKLVDSRSTISHGPERPGDVRHSRADVQKMRSAGFAPSCDFIAGLRATIESRRKTLTT